ncbi:uncharacterized protein LOC129259350 [Lytechinus pictus]|uniref:uncharacterized protein LOC129259350 n=1 Tax=Lytechinus pictus TaxID=7653 RepID=UPI0030B9CD2C
MFTVGLSCFIFLVVLGLSSCESVSKIQGQNVTLRFPYPCNTTEVTLQKSNRHPFYISMSGPDLFLSQSKTNRFKVYDKNDYDNCSVDLMISNLMKDDQGTYILFVYKDGDIQGDDTHRIYLKVDHPPGKASCVVGDEKGGDWVSLDCQANAGSLPGKIECYQTGVWMPTLAGPTETGSSLKQSILIRQSGPVFCCSSLIHEDRDMCECKDTSHYLSDGDYIDPCPTPSPTFPESTTMLIPSTFTENNQSDYSFVTPSTPVKMEEGYDNVRLIFLSSLGLATVLLYSFLVCVYKCNPTRKSNSNSSYDSPRVHNTMPLLKENERDSGQSKGKTSTTQSSL